MRPSTRRIAYSTAVGTGTTPGADSNTYTLFSTVTAYRDAGQLQSFCVEAFKLDLKYTGPGTLKPYKSTDRGLNWYQVDEHLVLTPDSLGVYRRDFTLDLYDDFKLDWVNGGSAQTVWVPSMGVTSDPASQYVERFKYFTNANMGAASIAGDWIDCRGKEQMILNLEWASTPSGSFQLQSTSDPARAAANVTTMTVPTTALHWTLTAGTVAIGDTGATVSPDDLITLAGATGNLTLNLTELPDFLKVIYTRSGSGSATLDGFLTLKPY